MGDNTGRGGRLCGRATVGEEMVKIDEQQYLQGWRDGVKGALDSWAIGLVQGTVASLSLSIALQQI